MLPANIGSMQTVEEKAWAKINLTLDIIGKRPDGYHELLTVFQALALHDTLSLSRNNTGMITLSVGNAPLPTDGTNLAGRAARLLQKQYGIQEGVHIILDKKIPIAAGLGGGSSDAAAVLRGLVRLWRLPLERDTLYSLAETLGSDVPFCLEGGTALGRGRGEKVEILPPCPHFFVVLANPGFAVSTAAVYQAFRLHETRERPDTEAMCAAIASGDRSAVGAHLNNVLETATFPLFPKVGELKSRMSLAGSALMCGSGPTVFALFHDRGEAVELYRALQQEGCSAWLTQTVAGNLLEVGK
ncbi:MAG: 4-(cytidine 5'-diphospho)-2-C-methyl-D-erythritol kinase [Clostridiales bacterium]|nr:4-(cytidine 5'-diphospho)-2-C-methyl-D-erythritol kinase [Clostridiales bacterium]